jgi:hypothetical protein
MTTHGFDDIAVSGSVALTNAPTINGQPTWIQVIKATDESRSANDTLTDDATLKFTVAANTKYRFRFRVFYTTDTDADFKLQAAGPAAPTMITYTLIAFAPGSGIGGGSIAGAIALTQGTAFGVPLALTETGGSVDGAIHVDGILHNGANAGTVVFQWAQNTSDAGGTIVRAGSYLEYSTVS